MRLRVVGGPIRRTDRIVLDVTSNTTFEAILALIFKKIEALDLADIAKDYFNASSTSPTTVPPKAPENDAFGDTVQEGEDSTSSSSGGDDGGGRTAPKKKKSYTLPRALSTRTVAGVTPCISTSSSRLSCPPLDFTHFHIALLEFGPDDKPFATRLCKKNDTPRSVHMRVPVIGLFLRKEFKAVAGNAEANALEAATMGLPGGIESPQEDALALPVISTLSPPDMRRTGESPLVRFTSPLLPQAPGEGPPLSNAKDMSLSRPLSFALHYSATTFPPSTALQRALALFGVSRNDGVNTARIQRILQKVGPGSHEVFLATAERALLHHQQPSSLYPRSPSDANVADAPIGMHFPLQNIKDVLSACLVKLDCGTPYDAAYESASILADMLVHAAPVGEELLYACVFLGFQLSDYHERLRTTGKIIDLSTAQWIQFQSTTYSLSQLMFLETTHRTVLERHELRSQESMERTLLMMKFYQFSFQGVSSSRRGSATSTTSYRPSVAPSFGPPVVDDDLVWERLAHYLSHELLVPSSSPAERRLKLAQQQTPTTRCAESTLHHLYEVPVTKPVFTPQRTATAKLVLEAPTGATASTSTTTTGTIHRDPASFVFGTERPPKAIPVGTASTPGGDSYTSFSLGMPSPTVVSGGGSPSVSGRIGTLERDVAQVKEALAQQTLLLHRLLERHQ